MKAISRFETNLLRILHCFLQHAPIKQVLPLLLRPCERPPCLSRAAVELVQDALAKGCLLLLARGGGWRRERHLRGERIVVGRLWERTPPEELGLSFSRHTLEFLFTVTAANLEDQKPSWKFSGKKLTIGDLLLFYFAYEAVRGTKIASAFRSKPPFAQHGLCWLAFPDDFADNLGSDQPDLTPWTTGLGACVLEALQPTLIERWLDIENYKGRIGDWRRMRNLGQAQERALNALLEALDKAGRWDLARFLLHTAAGLLRPHATAQAWVGELNVTGLRLADRMEIYRAALVLLRQLDRLRQRNNQARSTGYFDEGYTAAQLWKADWEHGEGEALCARAQAIIRELEPLPT
jgi:hypothetical protein